MACLLIKSAFEFWLCDFKHCQMEQMANMQLSKLLRKLYLLTLNYSRTMLQKWSVQWRSNYLHTGNILVICGISMVTMVPKRDFRVIFETRWHFLQHTYAYILIRNRNAEKHTHTILILYRSVDLYVNNHVVFTGIMRVVHIQISWQYSSTLTQRKD